MKTIKTIVLIFLILTSHNSFSQCWKEIAAGENHTLAIKTDGTLWAWGRNQSGQLGDGTIVDKNVPTQIGSDTDWASIDAVANNNLALKTDGSLWSWGENNIGQVGNGAFGTDVNSPIRIGIDNDWVKIAAIGAYAIKSNGTLWGWSKNTNGSLGTGNYDPHYVPIQIGTDSDWINVNIGSNQNLALKNNGTLWGWGTNVQGCLAIGVLDLVITVPTQTGNNSFDWLKIEAGGCCSSKMIKTDGSLWVMGSAAYGNLGTGSLASVNTPTRVGLDNDWESVKTGLHSYAIKTNGSLWGWGLNFLGQLGDGTLVNKNVPTPIATDKTWKKAVIGFYHSVALSTDGSLYAWGSNAYGQLGDGTFANKIIPTLVGNACPLSVMGFSSIQSLFAQPNPTNSRTSINYNLNQSTSVEFILVNQIGQIVNRQNTFGNIGANTITIELDNYSAGIYLLTLKTANESKTVKIIKQ